MKAQIIGVDFATDDRKVGLSRGSYENKKLTLEEVSLCPKGSTVEQRLTDWIRSGDGNTLIAIDAPLGWPEGMSVVLRNHEAGQHIVTQKDKLFRRETDRFIEKALGKRPLDVGADRIARTAHGALHLIHKLSTNLGTAIPLVWSILDLPKAGIIEVYPAATLKGHGINEGSYRAKEAIAIRNRIVEALSQIADFSCDRAQMVQSVDALDAAICAVAASDCLSGAAREPDNQLRAMKEGWIWAKMPMERYLAVIAEGC